MTWKFMNNEKLAETIRQRQREELDEIIDYCKAEYNMYKENNITGYGEWGTVIRMLEKFKEDLCE